MELTLRNNIKTVYWMFFFQHFMIIIAVFVPLLQRYNLSMSQVLQTQALFAFVVAITELPSGYLADLWGRKNTIILGQGLLALAYWWLIKADGYADFMVYEAMMGLGISLSSGADLALLYDTQTALNAENRGHSLAHGKHISRLVAIEGYAGAASGLFAGVLSLISLDSLLWAQFFVGFAALSVSICLVEAPRRISAGSHRQNFGKVVSTMLYRPLVLWTSMAIIVFSLLGLYAFWMYQKYWEAIGIPVTWFGYLWAAHCVIRGLVGHFAHEIEQRLGWRKVFALAALVPIIGLWGMGLFGGWVGIFFSLGLVFCRGLSAVVFYDALNKRVDGDFRATINSLVSLGTRGVFIVTGPLLGAMVDSRGVHNSLLIMASLLLPVILVVLYYLGGHIRRESAQQDEEGAPGGKESEPENESLTA